VRLIQSDSEVQAAPAKGILVRSAWQRRTLTFLMVFGPGLIVMEADNDAGAVSTYRQAGGQYGLHMLWLLVVLLPICYFIQEMVARLGIATGKGHAAMIYERFGKWWGRFSLIDLLAVNILMLITEFAGISLALSALGVSPYISVPLSAIGLTMMVVTGSYLRWERIVIALCLMDLSWFVLAFMVQPHWAIVAHNSVAPAMPAGRITSSLVFLVIAIVGTTIAPWQLFFQQSCVAEKPLRFADLKWARLDTLVGAIFTVCVAGLMMLVGNYGFENKIFSGSGATCACSWTHRRQLRSQRSVASDGQCSRAWYHCNLSCNRMGVRRGTRLATLITQEVVGSSGFLYNLHRLRWCGGGHRAQPPRTAATCDHQRPSLRWAHVAVGDHLSSTTSQ